MADEAPEIPIIDEDTPQALQAVLPEAVQPGEQPAALAPQQAEAAAAAATAATGAGLAPLHLPPASPADRSRRWSLDEAMDSWELLSHGHHSHCGSSPRSVSPSDAYDSEGEADEREGEEAEQRRQAAEQHPVTAAADADAAAGAEAAAFAAESEARHALAMAPAAAPTAALDTASAVEQQEQEQSGGWGAAEAPSAGPETEAELVAFGSLVLPPGEPSPREAGAEGEREGERAVPPSPQASSPRSSFERASNASRHDLYSLSQDGSADNLSDHDSYIDGMMYQGEPDMGHAEHAEHDHSTGGGAELTPPPTAASLAAARKPPCPLLPHHPSCAAGMPPLVVAAPAAAVAAMAHGAYASASLQLRQLAASVHAYLARIVPASAEVAQRVVRGMAEIVGSLRAHLPEAPQGLAPLASATNPATAAAVAATTKEQVLHAVLRTRKQLGVARVNWAKVAMALSVLCTGMGALLWRSYTEQARLSVMLAKREGELAKLLMQVFELRRNITAHRSLPIIRHVSTTGVAAAWPAVTVV